MSYYGALPAGRTVIVEDIPSAARAARYGNAIALLGTGVGADYAGEIAAHRTRIVWALDADATAQALRLQRRYSLLFEESYVKVLRCDLKDMPEEELKQLMGEIHDS